MAFAKRLIGDIFQSILRFLQFCSAVIILGSAGYLLKKAISGDHWHPRELILPLIFSALAIAFLIPSLFFGFLAKSKLTWAAIALMDFIIFVGYVASAGLLRRNFNGPGWQNELTSRIAGGRHIPGSDILGGRRFDGSIIDGHHIGPGNNYSRRGRISHLVKALSGFVVVNLILYFFTLLYSLYKAYRAHRSHEAAITTEKTTGAWNNRNLRGGDNRNSLASSDPNSSTTGITGIRQETYTTTAANGYANGTTNGVARNGHVNGVNGVANGRNGVAVNDGYVQGVGNGVANGPAGGVTRGEYV
ncbi:hypothetical protein BJ508DRAFT_75999 [Ascobolus immersus RN42]|uniref:MARVEL domain-containing protein n=1 Tax=Ascobolus immersus RN42 TaxID=1160509 RepID=A0A3N4HDI2_ASCIM|nr:hypothetical protein BJ508DRAFT_75999 [Ascobolus immersus RN42]